MVDAHQVITFYVALAELDLAMGAAVFNRMNLALAAPIQHDGLVPEGNRQGLIGQFGALGYHVPVVGVKAQLP
jgi:hypothetical protein